MADLSNTAISSAPKEWFATTHWSVVLAAGTTAAPAAQEALEKLCRSYWYPLYAFVRRQGHGEEAAKDLTQAFFSRLLEKDYLGQVAREKGKFRSFLLGSLKHFLADEWDKSQAQKRGGGATPFSLDDESAEDRYHWEPVDEITPDKLFDRRWALTVMRQAADRLHEEYRASGKAKLFEQLRRFLEDSPTGLTYAAAAPHLGMTENTLKSHVHRLRQRNREILREVITDTVASPAQVDEELRDLFAALSEA